MQGPQRCFCSLKLLEWTVYLVCKLKLKPNSSLRCLHKVEKWYKLLWSSRFVFTESSAKIQWILRRQLKWLHNSWPAQRWERAGEWCDYRVSMTQQLFHNVSWQWCGEHVGLTEPWITTALPILVSCHLQLYIASSTFCPLLKPFNTIHIILWRFSSGLTCS